METQRLIRELEDLLRQLGPETREAWADQTCCAVAGRCAGSYGCSVQCDEDPTNLQCNDQTCEDFPLEPECQVSVPSMSGGGMALLAAGLGGLAYKVLREHGESDGEAEDENV